MLVFQEEDFILIVIVLKELFLFAIYLVLYLKVIKATNAEFRKEILIFETTRFDGSIIL